MLLAAAGLAAAQGHGPSVAFASPEPVTVKVGKSSKIILPFRVASGYHVNSHQPHEDYLIATELKLEPPSGVMVSKLDYPAGKDISFPFAPDEKLSVYSDDFTVGVELHVLPKTAPGIYTLKGVLKFQACDNRACYPPKSTPVEFVVTVAKGLGNTAPIPSKSSGSQ